ncbi:hypothetical protein [Luteipulveratus halotolerans]|uniref:DUF304 domain-containing protein n=1 Tax=Luteipulveratus halotolerans TaxID=1631356 RepID=A0A0L6CM84_9MICO|nr:hypothetical protein [Luteipulveratus halotolerans]KNX38638.1 hypothetical protein VV01_18220 [Luteipulveratus halotolerans]
MSGEASEPKTFRNRGYAWICTAFAGLIVGACLIGLMTPGPEGTGDDAYLGWLTVAAGVAFIVRSWQVRVVIDGERVVRHGWFIRRSYPRRRVDRVESVRYAGFWTRGGAEVGWADMLCLTIDGRPTAAREVVGRGVTVERIAGEMSVALGLVPAHLDPVTGQARKPRHRAADGG